MNKALPRLAITLRWLSGLWIVGWSLYITLWDDARLSTVRGLTDGLAILLIPAAISFGLSCGLERIQQTDQSTRRT